MDGRARSAKRGFTLVELMITICIIGVLASVAIPTYSRFMYEVRSSEGTTSMGFLYKLAAAYWERPISAQGISATGAGHCVAMDGFAMQIAPPFPPLPEKRMADFSTLSIFRDLGFSRPEPGYFASTGLGACAFCAPGID